MKYAKCAQLVKRQAQVKNAGEKGAQLVNDQSPSPFYLQRVRLGLRIDVVVRGLHRSANQAQVKRHGLGIPIGLLQSAPNTHIGRVDVHLSTHIQGPRVHLKYAWVRSGGVEGWRGRGVEG